MVEGSLARERAPEKSGQETAGQRARAGTARLTVATFLLLSAATAVPVLAVKVPVMVDYPNHLARMYLIAHLGQDPALQHYYAIEWRLIPNLVMDLVVPALARHLDIFLAGKVFVLATLGLIATGAQAVHWALYRRISPGPLLVFVFLYNWIFLLGFLNYLFGVGAALWGIAAWILLRDARRGLRAAVSTGFVLLIFTSHLHALGLYGLGILSYELWRMRRAGPQPLSRRAPDLAVLILPFLIVLPLLGMSPTSGFAALEYKWRPLSKPDGIYFAVKTYDWPLDLATGLLAAGAALWAWRSRRLVLPPAAWYFAIAACIVYLALPGELMGGAFVDLRLPVAALFVLIGMAEWRLAARERMLFCGVVALLSLIRVAAVDLAWRHYEAIIADFERSFAAIDRGSRVLVAARLEPPPRFTDAYTLANFPCLVIIERSSFETLEFTHPGQQVLAVRPPYRDLAPYVGEPPDIRWVVAGTPNLKTRIPETYWLDWRRRFNYVYVLFAGPGTKPLTDGAALVYQGADFQLYRVKPPA